MVTMRLGDNMTVESSSQNTENAIIVYANYGVTNSDNSYCSPHFFQEAQSQKTHKRQGSLTGYKVLP